MALQARMAVLQLFAVLNVLSANVRLALHACSAMPERFWHFELKQRKRYLSVMHMKQLNKQTTTHWSN
ncbi:MAG TPA: hypothetical protein VK958_10660 [Methylophilus sp.]|uniref:hypothetical protein n=1 Tax=Methylophilus sp. TaxID=29541 RepID=UPI002D0636A5|nr:hypothetical protein [Methylophilus sp.]HSH87695.1 hypothetical protein [Methylophilus sp.]